MVCAHNDLVIFDLDGTLLDTSPGIFASVRYAEMMLNLPSIDVASLKQFVGPPPKEVYKQLYNLSDELAMQATFYHRKFGFETGYLMASLYDGISSLLLKLKDSHVKLAVGTLKKQKVAEMVLNNFNISFCFDMILGMDDNETLTKHKIISNICNSLKVQNAVMVGDTVYDALGAEKSGLDFIGVKYGFGFTEHETYNFKTVSKPNEIYDLIVY